VVYVVSKDGLSSAEQTLPATLRTASALLPDLKTPVDVLVNGNSASAAEVFAAALKVLIHL